MKFKILLSIMKFLCILYFPNKNKNSYAKSHSNSNYYINSCSIVRSFIIDMLANSPVNWVQKIVQIILFQKLKVLVLGLEKLSQLPTVHCNSNLIQNLINFLEKFFAVFKYIIIIYVLYCWYNSLLRLFLNLLDFGNKIKYNPYLRIIVNILILDSFKNSENLLLELPASLVKVLSMLLKYLWLFS